MIIGGGNSHLGMKQLSEYETVSAWYSDAKQDGWRVPLELCRGVGQVMKRDDVSFADAFSKLVREGKIVLIEKTYIFDLSALNLH